MERVTGIGGFFFRAADPDALGRWYAQHLGVEPPPTSYDVSSWWQSAGPTVFAPMGASEPYVEPPGWMLNLRVQDLDAMVAQLRAAGTDVEVDPETYPNGRFASLADPEGNRLQLWEPHGADARGPGGH